MSNPSFFRNWSWKKFGLDALFFIALFVLVNCIFVSFGVDDAMTFTGKEALRYLCQGLLFSFLRTVWDDQQQEPLFSLLLKKLK